MYSYCCINGRYWDVKVYCVLGSLFVCFFLFGFVQDFIYQLFFVLIIWLSKNFVGDFNEVGFKGIFILFFESFMQSGVIQFICIFEDVIGFCQQLYQFIFYVIVYYFDVVFGSVIVQVCYVGFVFSFGCYCFQNRCY